MAGQAEPRTSRKPGKKGTRTMRGWLNRSACSNKMATDQEVMSPKPEMSIVKCWHLDPNLIAEVHRMHRDKPWPWKRPPRRTPRGVPKGELCNISACYTITNLPKEVLTRVLSSFWVKGIFPGFYKLLNQVNITISAKSLHNTPSRSLFLTAVC